MTRKIIEYLMTCIGTYFLQAQREAKEAEELQKEMQMDGGLDSLRLAMAKNVAKRASFLDDLEKKYAGKEKAEAKKNGKIGCYYC
jgi:uncharacterized membrane-anchored protein YhcB (DUF1043 family)